MYDLLQKNYKVHGTVREDTPEKTEHLYNFPNASSNLKLFEADLLQPGSFDTALQGCQVAFHVASPYKLQVDHPQKELVDPALKGTQNFLESCKKTQGLTKVVATSSVAAITDEGRRNKKKYTEADWNNKSSLRRLPYYYSKTVAEKYIWQFAKENKDEIEIVVINPFMVIGPSHIKRINESVKLLIDIAKGELPGIMNLTFTFVDVRDVSKAHILAMENDKSEGRNICAAEPAVSMKETVEIMRKEGFNANTMDFRNPIMSRMVRGMSHVVPGGANGQYVRNNLGMPLLVVNEKIKKELGMQFRDPKETLKDTLEDLVKWGHLEKNLETA